MPPAVLGVLLVSQIALLAGGLRDALLAQPGQGSARRPANPVEAQRLAADVAPQVAGGLGGHLLGFQRGRAEVEQAADHDTQHLAHPLAGLSHVAAVLGRIPVIARHQVVHGFGQRRRPVEEQGHGVELHVDGLAGGVENFQHQHEAEAVGLGRGGGVDALLYTHPGLDLIVVQDGLVDLNLGGAVGEEAQQTHGVLGLAVDAAAVHAALQPGLEHRGFGEHDERVHVGQGAQHLAGNLVGVSDAHLLHNLGVHGENLPPDLAPDVGRGLGALDVLPLEGVEVLQQRMSLAERLGDLGLGLDGVKNPLGRRNGLSGR